MERKLWNKQKKKAEIKMLKNKKFKLNQQTVFETIQINEYDIRTV